MDIADISLIHPGKVETTLQSGLASKVEDAQKLKLTTEKFEAVLIRQYLSEAMKPLLGDTMMSNSTGGHMYQYMITDAMASELSSHNTFGVASLLQMQLANPENTKSGSIQKTDNQ